IRGDALAVEPSHGQGDDHDRQHRKRTVAAKAAGTRSRGGLVDLGLRRHRGTLAREARQRQCGTKGGEAQMTGRPAQSIANAPNSAAGHRARLRRRLLEGGAEALADYEVLEYLLFSAQARGDTKPLAKELLRRFGSLAGVLDAAPGALRQVRGVSDASVGAHKIAALAARRMARSEVQRRPVLGSWQALLDYLAIDMASLTVERVRVLYLNARNQLILDDHVGDGSSDEAAIHPREVIRRGLDIGATALILVHNH